MRWGKPIPEACDAILFPQVIYAAYRHDGALTDYQKPMVVLTSKFGTVEMWDWEIITYLRDLGLTVFSPYSVEMGKTVLRALGVKRSLKAGAKFLMFQDSPGEGMQAGIFKKFLLVGEGKHRRAMESVFGCRLIYRSWKSRVRSRARANSRGGRGGGVAKTGMSRWRACAGRTTCAR